MSDRSNAVTGIEDIDAGAVRDILVAASCEALTLFRSGRLKVDNKLAEGFDPVTQADRLVESTLRAELPRLVGELPIIGEEEGTTGDPSSGLAWIIDPIDGTRAFMSGQPQWGTLLGLLEDGEPTGGWLHLPVLVETFWTLGDDRGIRSPTTERFGVSDCRSIDQATMLSTDPGMFDGRLADAFAAVVEAVRLTRYSGDCHNYGLLVSGDVDLVVENQMQPYDILPLIPIIEAAGGVVTDRHGARISAAPGNKTDGSVIAAATTELHEQVMKLFAANAIH